MSITQYHLWPLSQILTVTHKYDLTAIRRDAERELIWIFPSQLKLYGRLYDFKWTDIPISIAITIAQRLTPVCIPAAMYEAAVRPIDETLAEPSYLDGSPFEVPFSIVKDILRFREKYHEWMADVKIRPRPPGRLLEGHDGADCTPGCFHFAAAMERYYRTGKKNVLVDTPTKTLLQGEGLCRSCLDHYEGFEKTLAQKLWALLPVWAGKQAWGDFPRSMYFLRLLQLMTWV